MKKTNTGKALENIIENSAKRYELDGKLMLRKCDPPSLSYNKNGRTNHVLLQNPFLDFIGSLPDGRCVQIEAKSTKDPRLHLGGNNGVTQKQIDSIKAWERFNVITFVIWEHNGNYGYLDYEIIQKITSQKRGSSYRKSIRWEESMPIHQGTSILCDFMATANRMHRLLTIQN